MREANRALDRLPLKFSSSRRLYDGDGKLLLPHLRDRPWLPRLWVMNPPVLHAAGGLQTGVDGGSMLERKSIDAKRAERAQKLAK